MLKEVPIVEWSMSAQLMMHTDQFDDIAIDKVITVNQMKSFVMKSAIIRCNFFVSMESCCGGYFCDRNEMEEKNEKKMVVDVMKLLIVYLQLYSHTAFLLIITMRLKNFQIL